MNVCIILIIDNADDTFNGKLFVRCVVVVFRVEYDKTFAIATMSHCSFEV